MTKVFLDANVLFSAAQLDSVSHQLFLALARRALPVTSDLAREEAVRNVLRKRPKWEETLSTVLSACEIASTSVFELPVELAAKDVPILCAAIKAGCDYFATGDKRDFKHLFGKKVMGIEVISLLRLAQLLAAERLE